MEKVSFDDLTKKQQENYGNGCGTPEYFLGVPNFIFTASCRQHDFNYERGGGLYYKIKADVDFYSHMVADAEESTHPLWYTFIATIYFIGVSILPIPYFFFSYGRWRSIDEILERDDKKKRSQ